MRTNVVFIHGIGQTPPDFAESWADTLRLHRSKWAVHGYYWESIADATNRPPGEITDHVLDFAAYMVKESPLRNSVMALGREVVKKLEQDSPTIVVAHSWGTVVAYDAFWNAFRRVKVKLLLTIGSPLWMPDVLRFMQWAAIRRPQEVARWVNVYNYIDPVGGFIRGLGVENKTRLWFRQPHDAVKYLRTKLIRGLIGSM